MIIIKKDSIIKEKDTNEDVRVNCNFKVEKKIFNNSTIIFNLGGKDYIASYRDVEFVSDDEEDVYIEPKEKII